MPEVQGKLSLCLCVGQSQVQLAVAMSGILVTFLIVIHEPLSEILYPKP